MAPTMAFIKQKQMLAEAPEDDALVLAVALVNPRQCLLPSSVRWGLEAELESEFNLPRRAEGVNAGSDTYPSNVSSNGVGPIDLPDGSVQSSIQLGKIGKVEQVVETNAGLHTEPLAEPVNPGQLQIERTQPGKVDLSGRGEGKSGSDAITHLLQLRQGEQAVLN